MKRILLIALVACLSISSSFAQLPNGSLAPDWTLTDVLGVEHNLYSYLDSGYTVFIDFSAVWCGPCWSYHTGGTLESLYELHGPAGFPHVDANTTDDVMVFFIEGDGNSLDCLNGINCSNTYGDWVNGVNDTDPNSGLTPYPVICTDGTVNNTAVTSAYSIGYWPTVYMVCPDRIVTEAGQSSNPYNFVSSCPPPTANINDIKTMTYAGATETCMGDLTPEIKVQNYGLGTLTSFNIEVLVNGISNSTTPWTGSLQTYQLIDITLPTVTGITGNSNIEIITSNPNGGLDDDLSNNNIQFSTIPGFLTSINSINIIVAITTDQYGAETTWDIKTSSGLGIASGGPWSNLGASGTTVQAPVNVTLSQGECYTFTIYDAYGDGINSGYGVGSYSVTDGNGTVLASGGTFTDEESEQFRTDLSSTSISENTIVNAISIYPNPVNDIATLSFTTTEKSKTAITIFNILGEVVYSNEIGSLASGQHIMPISTSGITEGMYFVNLITNNKIITKKITIVR